MSAVGNRARGALPALLLLLPLLLAALALFRADLAQAAAPKRSPPSGGALVGLVLNAQDNEPPAEPVRNSTFFTFCNLIPGDSSAVARLVRDRSYYTPALQYQQCTTQKMLVPRQQDQILEVYHAPGSIASDQRQITRTYVFNAVNGSENLLLLTQDPAHGLWELTIPKTPMGHLPEGDPPLMDVVLFNGITEFVSWKSRSSENNGRNWTSWALIPGALYMDFKGYRILGVLRNDSAQQLAEFAIDGVGLPPFRVNFTEVAEHVKLAHAPDASHNTSEPPSYPVVRILVALTGQVTVGLATDSATDCDEDYSHPSIQARRNFPLEFASYFTTSDAVGLYRPSDGRLLLALLLLLSAVAAFVMAEGGGGGRGHPSSQR